MNTDMGTGVSEYTPPVGWGFYYHTTWYRWSLGANRTVFRSLGSLPPYTQIIHVYVGPFELNWRYNQPSKGRL